LGFIKNTIFFSLELKPDKKKLTLGLLLGGVLPNGETLLRELDFEELGTSMNRPPPAGSPTPRRKSLARGGRAVTLSLSVVLVE
jgi:hypothetical protein